jgi:alpha-glucosidase
LLALRKAEPALAVGDWSLVAADGDLLAYERSAGGRRLLVALNLGHEPIEAAIPAPGSGTVLLSTRPDGAGEAVAGRVTLRPDEGRVIALDG